MTAPDPSPDQLALLRDIDAGKVHHIFQRSAVYDINTATGRRVTVPIRRLRAAGWIRPCGLRCPRRGRPSHQYAEWCWQLTTAGRTILEGARR